jgi:nicotinic acid mononucleotide adenylyltransferase
MSLNQILIDDSRIEIIKAPLFKNRSTLIRESLTNKKFDAINDTPKEVKMYIQSQGLYHTN